MEIDKVTVIVKQKDSSKEWEHPEKKIFQSFSDYKLLLFSYALGPAS